MDDELMHYGIKGQKWGIRRYQNKDGTLTPAGRKKYKLEIKEENKKEFRSYVCGHIGIEFLISFIISYFIIALTSSNV